MSGGDCRIRRLRNETVLRAFQGLGNEVTTETEAIDLAFDAASDSALFRTEAGFLSLLCDMAICS